MADKTPGYFPDYPIRRKLKAKGLNPDSDATEHDSILYDLWSAHGGAKRLREEFLAALADAEARFASGELGVLGLQKAKASVVEDHTRKLEQYRSAETHARKYEQRLRGELTARPKPESKSADEAVERAFQRHRAITRFENLEPSQRREALRIALEKRDHGFLSILLSEPALIDEESARRVEVELMRASDRQKFNQLQELTGLFDYDGQPDPLQGALPVLSYALDSTRDWFVKQAGIDTPPQPKIKGDSVILTPEQVKNPADYRAARDAAEAQGLELIVEE